MKKIILYGFVFCALSAAVFGPEAGAARLQDGESATVYYRDGVRYVLEGRLDEAAAAFEQAARLDPKNGDANYSLGNVYSEQGRWAEAVGAYRLAVFLKKKDGAAYNGLGLALGALGDYEQAAVAFKRAIEIYPAWAEPRFHLSQVYGKLGRDEAAQVAYSEALERRPDYAANPPRSFMTETGEARVEPRGQKAAAVNVATSARSAPPPPGDEPASGAARPDSSDASTPYELGLRHSRAGRLEEAVASLRQAVGLDRDNAAAYSALGSAYAQMGRWRESVDAYEQAVRLDPRDANAYEMLGRSYAKLREATTQTATSLGEETATGMRTASTSGASAAAPSPREKSASATPDEPLDAEPNSAPGGGAVKSGRLDPAAAGADADPTAIYRVGPGDVLEVRAPHVREQSRTTAYKVTPTGLLDYPPLGVPLKVAGLTTDEIAARLGAELKRRGETAADSEVLVGVREFESHAIIVSGLVKDPGTKILRREGVPLYVIVAHAQPLPEAGRVLVASQATGRSVAVNLADAAAMNMLVRPGDVLTVQAHPKQYVYIVGAVRQPGQKEFHAGLTLTQAILAAGGALPADAPTVTVTRQGGDGRLATTRYSLKDIEAGKSPDPVMQSGDRVEVLR